MIFSQPPGKPKVPQHSVASAANRVRRCATYLAVGAVRLGSIATRRARYCARFVYWTLRHGSPRNVAWILAYEGYSWN